MVQKNWKLHRMQLTMNKRFFAPLTRSFSCARALILSFPLPFPPLYKLSPIKGRKEFLQGTHYHNKNDDTELHNTRKLAANTSVTSSMAVVSQYTDIVYSVYGQAHFFSSFLLARIHILIGRRATWLRISRT